jgi:lipid II isoglutaminyl synthase (glutamine-hydrolysing)
MSKPHITLLGKAIRHASRLKGGGSALPGLVVEKLDKNFLPQSLAQLPHGVVVISGTNGKTTTTKMVTSLLDSQGLRVFTNPTGSNFTRGVISSILEKTNLKGVLEYDIAVLELDEAHAVHFVREVAPRYCLLLNVMRDQLDRFGEIDTTADMLHSIARATTNTIVLNRDDPRLQKIATDATLDARIRTFGISEELTPLFPSDDDLYGERKTPKSQSKKDDVCLEKVKESTAAIRLNGKVHTLHFSISGVYNILNATGALALVDTIVGKNLQHPALFSALENVQPAFGRGEKLIIDGQPLELILVKNPSGFRLGLTSFSDGDTAVMIAINDNYADGRDMSWLWDVNFVSLAASGVRMVSGVRAYDMALRLDYDEVAYDFIEPDLLRALDKFVHETARPKRIFCTYTAMLKLRKELEKYTTVERVL